ncbi:MAG: hypothetical protein ACAH80_02085 [Alphaproteobacteria bacterium]
METDRKMVRQREQQDNVTIQSYVLLAISLAFTIGGLFLGRAWELHLFFTLGIAALIAGLIFYSLISEWGSFFDTLLFFTICLLIGLCLSIPVNSPYVSAAHRDLFLYGATTVLSMNMAASLALAFCMPRAGQDGSFAANFYATFAAVFIAGVLLYLTGVMTSPLVLITLGICSLITSGYVRAKAGDMCSDGIFQLAFMYVSTIGIPLLIAMFAAFGVGKWDFLGSRYGPGG